MKLQVPDVFEGESIMRNVLLVVACLAWSAASASGQSSWAEKMFKDGTTHDFGSVPRGTVLYHRFKISNIYAVPLEISARVGCHCVTATPSTRVLQPREEGYVDVTMDTRKFPGPRKVDIHFTVGPEYISTAILNVSAVSRTDIVLNPGQISFGIVVRGQKPAPQTIDVEYAGVLDWRATELAKHTAPLEATFKELYRRPGQVGYRVTVGLKPDAPAGALKHDLFLKTNDSASPLVPILVEATIQASLSVAPDQISLGTLRLGESLTKLVLVRGSKPFRVLAIDGQEDGITAELPTVAKEVQIVKIKCHPIKAGALRRQLKIKTDLEKEEPVTVTVEGIVEP
jgi:hypothetical protein